MRFKELILVLSLFITLIVFMPTILSDNVEITIEYGTTTTTMPGATTTTTQSRDGDGSGDTTITLPENILPEAVLTYSMPDSYELYQNETGFLVIKVKNNGTISLHDIRIGVTGIPTHSYSISPSSVDLLEVDKSTLFYFSIDPQNITAKTYLLTIMIASNETYETTYLTLKINPFTREIGEKIEEQEEFEEVTKPALISINSILIGVILSSSIVAIIMLMRLKVNRCPLCGGEVIKDYEGENFISYKCSQCTYYSTKMRKK